MRQAVCGHVLCSRIVSRSGLHAFLLNVRVEQSLRGVSGPCALFSSCRTVTSSTVTGHSCGIACDNIGSTTDDNDIKLTGTAHSDGGSGRGGPVRLSVVRPDVVDDWIPELNDVNVHSVHCYSPQLVWWRCSHCSNNYQARVKDRTMRKACCPYCHERVGSTAGADGSVTEAASKGAATTLPSKERRHDNSLLHTHPELALRWDVVRNGTLTPAQVTSESTSNVWWKPKRERAHEETSFRRPVFAFVACPYSPAECMEAEAELETQLLQEIRNASRIDSASVRSSLPPTASHSHVSACASGMLKHRPLGGDDDNSSWRPPTCGASLSASEMRKVVDLWKDQTKPFLQESLSSSPLPAASVVLRHCFNINKVHPRTAAAACRREMLQTFHSFILARKGDSAAPACPLPSAVLDNDWLSYFTLSEDEVQPRDHISPTAALFFSVMGVSTAVEVPAGTGHPPPSPPVVDRLRRLPKVPTDVDTVFYADRAAHPMSPLEYPHRRLGYPTLPEEDVTEATPVETVFYSTHQDAAASVAQWGDGSNGMKSQRGESDGAGSRPRSTRSTPMWGRERLSNEYDSAELLDELRGDKVSMVNEVLSPGAAKRMQYQREEAAPLSQPHRTSERRPRFRLRMPSHEESAGGVLGSESADGQLSHVEAMANADLSAQGNQVFEAPRSPRKVARPRRASFNAGGA